MAKPKRPDRKGKGQNKRQDQSFTKTTAVPMADAGPKLTPASEPAFFSSETAQTAHYKKPDNEAIIDALYAARGNVTLAADKLQVSRRVMYDWMEEYPELETHKDKARRQGHDHVESKLHELIDGVLVERMTPDGPKVYQRPPCKTSVIFYLKAQAGWSESPKRQPGLELNELEKLMAENLREAHAEHGSSQGLPVQSGAVPVSDPLDSEDQCQ